MDSIRDESSCQSHLGESVHPNRRRGGAQAKVESLPSPETSARMRKWLCAVLQLGVP